MTLIQEATGIMEKMPRKNQQMVVDLLKMMYIGVETVNSVNTETTEFKRTGKSDFNLPIDFDEHFDDINDEIAVMFSGESV